MKRFLPAIIFLVAFGYRLLGIGWGLPSDKHHQSYHPDEEVIWTYAQAIEPGKLKFTPGFYNYGTLYLTTLRIATDMVSVYGGHMPQPEGVAPSSPTLTDWQFVGRSHKAGRVISAICGALIPLLIFLILRRRTNLLGATLGAALAAFAPGLVVHSRFQTVDVMATMLLVASAYFALRLIPAEGDDASAGKMTPMKLAVWSGVFAGLSAGTKYTGFLAIFTLIAALWLARNPDKVRLSLAGFGSMMFAFLLATPGALLDSAKFMKDFKYEMTHTSTGHGLLFEQSGSGFVAHLVNLNQAVTPVALLLCFIGLGFGLFVRPKAPDAPRFFRADNAWLWALVAFALPYYILIGRAEVTFLRYTFPLILVLAGGFGWLAGWAHDRKGPWIVLPGFSILSLGLALMVATKFTAWMAQPDPRDRSADLLREQAKDGEVVGLVSDPWYYTPSLFPDSAMSRMPVISEGNPTLPFIYQIKQMLALTKPGVIRYFPTDDANARYDWDMRLLSEYRPAYVVYSSFEEADVRRLAGKKNLGEIPKLLVDRYLEFRKQLEQDYAPLIAIGDANANFLAHDLLYIQPTIYIWKRKTPAGSNP